MGQVRALGAGTSWSPLVPTEGSLIDSSALEPMFVLDVSRETPTVRVHSGMRIGDLVQRLARLGLQLRSPTVFQGVSIGGAIATGSHGTGLCGSSLSDEVERLTLVSADGEVHELTAKDGDAFRAAQLSLGALGVVHDITLRVEPKRNMFVEDRYCPVDRVFSSIDDLLGSHPFVELYWFPFSSDFFCKTMRPVDSALDPPTFGERLRAPLQRALTWSSVLALLPATSHAWPSLTRTLAAMAPNLSSFVAGERVEASTTAFHYQTAYPACLTMSYAVPIAETVKAFRVVMDLVESEGKKGRYPVNMVAHARFIGPSLAHLSQAEGRAVCDLEVVTARGTRGMDSFYWALADAFSEMPLARPHWGKHFLREDRVRRRYPKLPLFLREQQRFDPSGAFLNPFLRRTLLGDSPRPAPV